MRLAFAASALCLSFLAYAIQPATSQTAAPANQAAAPANQAAAPTNQAAAPAPAPTPATGDAAARHAKRTACLKETKATKLVGAEKTAFLKNCIGAAPEAISASRISPPDRP